MPTLTTPEETMPLLTTTRPSRHLNDRRGVATGIMLVLLLVGILFLGLVVEMGLLYQARLQLQAAAEAAALAGAAELMDDDVLRPLVPASQDDDVDAARRIAWHYAGANAVAGQTITLVGNTGGAPADAVTPGTVHFVPGQGRRFVPRQPGGRADTLQVHLARSDANRHPIGLWFTTFLGNRDADIGAIAWARLNQYVLGFRPTPSCRVPMLPLAAIEDGSSRSWTAQAFATPVPGGNDRFSIAQRTGAVSSGADAIPEVLLQSNDATLWLLRLPASAQATDIARHVAEGIDADDLAPLGGALLATSPGGTPRVLGAAATIPSVVVQALRDAIGANRVWPLVRRQSPDQVQLVGFAAGRIVQVRETNGNVAVRVQPDQIITPTALTSLDTNNAFYNPWIGKLEIVH